MKLDMASDVAKAVTIKKCLTATERHDMATERQRTTEARKGDA